ncbi:hypothetical protein HFO56_01055 [Rhizobium laguerreae]|uniref:hypothetical protein n=1 Tax=Rhizobium laguerreae TaxID=1076926 RepID=UPI001C91A59C|nr:hypothetical protein [Rhizobium laguerreae]MBY3151019.1 hypothetical protein [Rhizobium laguerreae]
MSITLPREAKQYVDPSSTTNSLRQLCDAVDAGAIDLSALVAYAKTAGSGEAPRFRVTSPLPVAMLKAIQANPREERRVVYAGYGAGAWTLEDVENYEHNAAALHEAREKATRPPAMATYRTRKTTPQSRRPNVGNMFTAKVSMEALSRPGLSDGAKQCLVLLVGLADKDDTLTTYTTSLATMMDRTPRTIRNYYVALEDAGLIFRRPASHYNTVHITLHPDCRPLKYEEPRDVRAFKLARKSSNPALHLMAMSVVIASVDAHADLFTTSDRRKEVSVFNLESNSLRLRLGDNPVLSAHRGAIPKKDYSGLSAPTTHSTLLLDPKRPVNGGKPGRRMPLWAKPSGFNQVGAV